MLSPWSGVPDGFVLEDYLERYGDAIEACPQRYAGRWAQACRTLDGASSAEGFQEVWLDLGCGKGTSTVELALRNPNALLVGIDIDATSIACAAQLATESGVHNVVFVPGRDGTLESFFSKGELVAICLSFPTPCPKGRDAGKRLTCASRLLQYRKLLSKSGQIILQTDNRPFFSYTLGQMETASYEVLQQSLDARSELPCPPETAYGQRAIAKGAKIFALRATPGPEPVSCSDSMPTSLYEYLPEDLEDLGYVPPEMTRGIAAIRRTRASAAEKTGRR